MPLLFFLDEAIPWTGVWWITVAAYATLGLMTVICIVLTLWKFIIFRRAQRTSKKFVELVVPMLKAGEWEAACALSETYLDDSHLARIVNAGLTKRAKLFGKLNDELVIKHMEGGMERVTLVTDGEFKLRLGMLEAIGSTAQFVGLSGVSPYTFGWGTLLAIFALMFASYFRGRTATFEAEMKHVSSDLATYTELSMPSHASALSNED